MGENYVGRFAPSPTGPLHLGSLYIALASYLDAKHHGGRWLIRIEDVDRQRSVKGLDAVIVKTLSQHGLVSDGPIVYQSDNDADYNQLINTLFSKHQCFFCSCSRKTLRNFQGYPGYCREQIEPKPLSAIKLKVNASDLTTFNDRYLGHLTPQLIRHEEYCDFILKRKEGFFSYHLACTFDDAKQGITHVLRGVDLVNCTFEQCYLFQLLNFKPPLFCHLPILTNQQGIKLSKQNLAKPIDNKNAFDNLLRCLELLHQPRPLFIAKGDVQGLLKFAIKNWSLHHIPKNQKKIPINE